MNPQLGQSFWEEERRRVRVIRRKKKKIGDLVIDICFLSMGMETMRNEGGWSKKKRERE